MNVNAQPTGRLAASTAEALPRLLPEDSAAGPLDLAQHLDHNGPLPTGSGATFRETLITQVEQAGLTGRGGAAFPTARKLAGVAPGRRPVVVANGTEGEPASAKDKVLLARSPHLVLDGAVIAATAIGARTVIVVVHHSVRAILAEALHERAGRDPVRIRLVTGTDRFVAGEAGAVVHWIEKGLATPIANPPRLSERGLHGRPTLVQNVETLAHMALIVRFGPAWFRALGTAREPGSMLVTLTGAVRAPCVREVAVGAPVGQVLELAGGPSAPMQALVIGGYYGTWVPAHDIADVPLSAAGLTGLGAGVGAGLIGVLPEDACGLAETARIVRYLAEESAGQCGPCRFGLPALATQFEQLAAGRPVDRARLHRWLGQVDGRGACGLPDGAVRLIRSALRTFAAEVDLHTRGTCSATRPAGVLPIPERRAP